LRFALISLLALTACKKDPVEGPFSECDPLDTALCALPWPSSFYLVEADTPTGFRVNFGPTSLPVNRDDMPLDPTLWNEKDGFSTSGPLMTYFADVSLDGVVSHVDLGRYLDDDARTVILDAETGERVPHWVELDMTAEDAEERLLVLRNAAPFEHSRRYIVGIRGLTTSSGGSVAVSTAFAALRDGTETDDYDVEGRRQHFEDEVFPALEAAGFARGELQLAWDFVTVSRENSLGRSLWMRDDMIDRVGPTGPSYEVVNVEEGDCSVEGEHIARSLDVVMTVPSYQVADEPGSLLTRDDQGMPFYNGDIAVDVRVRIPCSLAADPRPAPAVQYGHGLLGDRYEVNTGWLSELIDENGWVAFATDWTGMSSDDVNTITLMLATDLSGFGMIPERGQQGLIEAAAATELMAGAFASDPAVTFDGVSVVDPNQIFYYGNSQGGIIGTALMGVSSRLERGVLGVPGGPYSLLLSRSVDFEPFFLVFKNKYSDHREIMMAMGILQMLWDPAEGAGWLGAIRDPGEGELTKHLLFQAALGDAQVTPLGAEFLARGVGAATVAPQTRPVEGVEERAPGFVGSALVEWSYSDVPEAPVENLPPEGDLDTHECPRRQPEAQAQIADFFATGTITQTCDGVCEALRAEVCP
jgi:hypothetical protein